MRTLQGGVINLWLVHVGHKSFVVQVPNGNFLMDNSGGGVQKSVDGTSVFLYDFQIFTPP